MKIDFEKIVADISRERKEIIDRMADLTMTDLLLFWGREKELVETQQKIWGPILEWAGKFFDDDLKKTHGLEIPEQDRTSGYRVRAFLNGLSDKELAAFYVAGTITKSSFLAAALVKKEISAEKAFEAAFLEERWQARAWGSDEDMEKRQAEIKDELKSIEVFLAA